MDDPFEAVPGVPSTSSWGDWYQDIFMRILASYGHVSDGEQQIAVKLAAQLYKEGLDSREAAKEAMARAAAASTEAKLEAKVALEVSYIGTKQKYPKIFK